MNKFQPDQTMLHQYLQNKLSPTEEEQLELWLADHPDVLEDLELDLMMQAGVGATANNKKQEMSVSHVTKTQFLAKLKPHMLVSSLVLTVGLMGYFIGQYPYNSMAEKTSIGPNVTIVRAAQIRANTPSAVINKSDGVVIMVLEISGLSQQPHHVLVEQINSGFSELIKDLYPQEFGDLVFPLSVQSIKPGTLRLTITESNRDQHIAYIDLLIQ